MVLPPFLVPDWMRRRGDGGEGRGEGGEGRGECYGGEGRFEGGEREVRRGRCEEGICERRGRGERRG